jgi:hypothetical protein
VFGVGAGAGVEPDPDSIRIVNVEIKALAPLGLFEQDPDRVSLSSYGHHLPLRPGAQQGGQLVL